MYTYTKKPSSNAVMRVAWREWCISPFIPYLSLTILICRYWDWTLDARDPAHSTIWDAKVGVGGNGDPKYTNPVGKDAYECVSDGPFRNLRPAYLQDDRIPHCLSRHFNNGTEYIGNMLASEYTPNVINKISKLRDYNSYRISLESGPHGAVHSAIGGDMSPATSPNGKT